MRGRHSVILCYQIYFTEPNIEQTTYALRNEHLNLSPCGSIDCIYPLHFTQSVKPLTFVEWLFKRLFLASLLFIDSGINPPNSSHYSKTSAFIRGAHSHKWAAKVLPHGAAFTQMSFIKLAAAYTFFHGMWLQKIFDVSHQSSRAVLRATAREKWRER